MSEIKKFNVPDTRPRPKILGAPDIDAQGRPQILDNKTRQEQDTPEIRIHSQAITEGTQVRQDRRVDAPQVRVRTSDQKAWQRAKRVED